MSGGTLAGQVALVTGVSSGLGRAVAIACVQAGAAVLGVARRRELGEELQHPGQCHPARRHCDRPAAPDSSGEAGHS